ncbi:MAG: hypothetical protein ACREXM_11315 [Gammaproteobacteria bacterium]
MKTTIRKAIAATLLVSTLSVSLPSWAIFGIGDIVYDPTNWVENAGQYLAQLDEVATTISQYEQMLLDTERWLLDKTGITALFRLQRAYQLAVGKAYGIYGRLEGLVGGGLTRDLLNAVYASSYATTPTRPELIDKLGDALDSDSLAALNDYLDVQRGREARAQELLQDISSSMIASEERRGAIEDMQIELNGLGDMSELRTLQTMAAAQGLQMQQTQEHLAVTEKLLWQINEQQRIETDDRNRVIERLDQSFLEGRLERVGGSANPYVDLVRGG